MLTMMSPATRKPTIRDVAKLAEVGLMTVSRVINDRPSVRGSTRKRVEAAIAKLGYQRNEAARLLKGQRSQVIGLILPDLSDSFFAVCANSAQQIARAHGYMTLIVSSERDVELEYAEAELMASRQVSGLLIVTSARSADPRMVNLQNGEMAIAAFDRPLYGMNADSVVMENEAGARAAVDHLLEHGHRRIACVGHDHETYTIAERVKGYTASMKGAGLAPQVALGFSTLSDVRMWLHSVLLAEDRPTALFSLNHRTSVFLLQCLAEERVSIPDEMALIGFDEFELASVLSPPLTTVAQSPEEMTKRAMNLLLSNIRDADAGVEKERVSLMMPTQLIIRQSCGRH